MKRTALALLVGLTLVSIQTTAQEVSFSGDHVPLTSFFSSVTKQTGFVFFFNASLFDQTSPVTVHLEKMDLDSALRTVLKNLPVIFRIQGRTIFISSSEPQTAAKEKNISHLLKISGRVTDQHGLPIGNASVSVLRSKNLVITNENGYFEMTIKKGDSIEISSVGYGKKIVYADGSFQSVVLHQISNPLEEVIVGGNLFATKRKSDISSVTVIDSKTLESLPVTNIAEIYRGFVPGTNSNSGLELNPESFSLTIRGAGSETSLSAVDVYVDGIEWAGGSGYLASINKENIDRIEVLRGPESSTLYGTGSNGGIVQIFTKKASPQTNNLTVRASAGFIQSIWLPGSAFQQYYTINKTIGFKKTAVTVGGTYQSNGAWLPGGGGKNATAYVAFKWNPDKKFSADVSGYYAGSWLGVSRTPVYDTITNLSDSVRQYYSLLPRKLSNKASTAHNYFAGFNLSYHVSSRWTHQLAFGFSQNDNHESPVSDIDQNGLVPDNFYQSVNKTTTLRYSNLLNLGDKEKDWSLGLMTGADYKHLFYDSRIKGTRPFIRSDDPPNTNVGFFTQVNPSYKNIYLTAALRYDYNKLFKDNHSLNPRIGLTTNFEISKFIVKPRVSWGSGITAPSYQARYGYPGDGFSRGAANPDIKPQQQSGFDYAMEFFSHRGKFSGEIVYYDNVLQNIFVDNELPQDPNGLYVFQVTNLGSIANKGWEFSGKYNLSSRFTAYATFSIMHSVLKDTAGGYLSSQFAGRAPGYQLKFLPKHTAGLFLNYNFNRLFRKKDRATISVNITEVDGIVQANTFQWLLDLAHQVVADNGFNVPEKYWVSSGTIFRVGLHLSYDISSHFQFIAQGNNILNQNNAEIFPYNATHGANWLFGFKYSVGN